MIDGAQILVSPAARTRVADFVTLTKPELTSLSVLTALCGFYLASESFDLISFAWVGLGTLFLGSGAGALNQYLEREYDGLMKRTERRPLPSGRMHASTALIFGILLSVAGLGVLFALCGLLPGILGALTISSYLFLYTPMKRLSPVSTLVGGIPGALPPLIGWSAASDTISLGGWILFLILFFWQMPHFFSLAWMYRKDYARAGYKMLTAQDPVASKTSLQIVIHTVILLVVSVFMTYAGLTGIMYAAGAVILGVSFVLFALRFRWSSGDAGSLAVARTNQYSRYLFFASLLYLPALMFLMTVDKV